MSAPNYLLYVVNGMGASNNALALLQGGDSVNIQPVDLTTIPKNQRPRWLEGVPTLANFRPEPDGVWRGPIWEGINAIRKLRELCPKGMESIESSIATEGDETAVQEVEEGEGGCFIGMDCGPNEGEEGMTLDEGLFSVGETPACNLPVNGSDNIEDLNAYVQACIERRNKDAPEEVDD
jgi:hypothetical protein